MSLEKVLPNHSPKYQLHVIPMRVHRTGILSCGLTHTAVVPLDHVKCNVQANPEMFPNSAVGFRKIYSGEYASKG